MCNAWVKGEYTHYLHRVCAQSKVMFKFCQAVHAGLQGIKQRWHQRRTESFFSKNYRLWKAEHKTTIWYQTNAWHAVRGFCGCDISLDTCSLRFFRRIEQKQNRLGQSTMEHTSNKYLSILRLDVWLSEQAEHRLMQSFVWVRPVNEDQSLPSPAGTDSNQQLMKAL